MRQLFEKIFWAVIAFVAIFLLFAFLPQICMLAIIFYIAYKLFLEEKAK